MNTADVLRAAADQISQPRAWTQGAMARAGNNRECGARSMEARSWCAIGAINASTDDEFLRRDAQCMAECVVPGHDIAEYNDRAGRRPETVARRLRDAAYRWELASTEPLDETA